MSAFTTNCAWTRRLHSPAGGRNPRQMPRNGAVVCLCPASVSQSGLGTAAQRPEEETRISALRPTSVQWAIGLAERKGMEDGSDWNAGDFLMFQRPKECSGLAGSDKLERVMGIEPTYSAWKAAALPLSYTRTTSCYNRTAPRSRDCSGLAANTEVTPRAHA